MLETLTAAVKAAPEAAAQWEQQISGAATWGAMWGQRGLAGDGTSGGRAAGKSVRGALWSNQAASPPPSTDTAEPALNAWVANVADPLLSIDARELLEALAALPACLPALQARRCWAGVWAGLGWAGL